MREQERKTAWVGATLLAVMGAFVVIVVIGIVLMFGL